MQPVGGMARIALVPRNPSILIMPGREGFAFGVLHIADKWPHDMTRAATAHRCGLFHHAGEGSCQGKAGQQEKGHEPYQMIRLRRQPCGTQTCDEGKDRKDHEGKDRRGKTKVTHDNSRQDLSETGPRSH